MSLVEDNGFILGRPRRTQHVDSLYSINSSCPSMTSSSPSIDSSSPAFSDHRRGSLASSSSWNEVGSYPSSFSMSMSPQTPCPQTPVHGAVPTTESSNMSLGWVSVDVGDGHNNEYMLNDHTQHKVNDGLGFYPMQQQQNLLEPQHDMWSYGFLNNLSQQPTNPCLSMPMFQAPNTLEDGHSAAAMQSWIPYGMGYHPSEDRPLQQRTIEPSLISDAPVPGTPIPVTPSPSYSDYPANGLYTRTPTVGPYMDSSPIKGTPNASFLRNNNMTIRRSFEDMSPVHGAGVRKNSSSRGSRNNKKMLCKKRTGSWSAAMDVMDDDNFKADCIYEKAVFLCKVEGCPTAKAGRGFKRQEHLKRHERSCHSDGPKHPCWVPGCDKLFDRTDNLNAHRRTHAKKKGRNRYVSTLDPTSPDYDPEYRGLLTIDGRPDRSGQMGHESLDVKGWADGGDFGASRRRRR